MKDEDAKMRPKAILAMRGANQKRHKPLHEAGKLKLKGKPQRFSAQMAKHIEH